MCNVLRMIIMISESTFYYYIQSLGTLTTQYSAYKTVQLTTNIYLVATYKYTII